MAVLVREDAEIYGLGLLELRNDFVFKSFFTNERNNGLLLHFVNSIVGGRIRSLQVIDPTNKQEHRADKLSVLDLRATTDRGEWINIELQLQHHLAFKERVLYYWAKTYTSQSHSSDPYTKLRKAIQIVITDFELLPSRRIHSTFQLRETSSGDLFTDHLEVHTLQLGKQGDKPVNSMNDLEKWLLFFKGDQKAKEEAAMESSAFEQAWEEIRKLSMDPETVGLAISREKALRDQISRLHDAENRGLEKGMEKGLEKGYKNRTIEMVLKLHQKSMPLPFIAEVTDLSVEEVQTIIEERNYFA
ncbi:putative transposase/invertase (TIGR01784 family) [Sporosarcina luteola]|nr:putative transposase/invertase (TIGR01784 family) [Sporosarcina luteola]